MSDLGKLVERLEKVTVRLEQLSVGGGAKAPSASSSGSAAVEDAPYVTAFDQLISSGVKAVVDSCNKIGGDLSEMGKILEASFHAQRDFLCVASQSKKPDYNGKPFQELLGSISKQIGAASDCRNKKRTSELFNHLSTISEGIPALGWVVQDPTPVPYIKEMIGAADFYGNKILVAKKGDATHVDFVKAYKALLSDLAAYVKEHHTTGVAWNARGGDLAAAKTSKPAPAPTAGGPPPVGPPPPPPANMFADIAKGASAEVDRSQLFNSLNNPNITSGLKKVTDDMKSKNRKDRSGVVSDVPKKEASSSAPVGKKDPFQGTPKFANDNNKWSVEYQIENKGLQIESEDFKQAVYMLRCKNSLLTIKNKINSLQIDSCQGGAIQLDDCVASCEIVNSKGVSIQVTGVVPTFTIDKCSGINIYLSKGSLGTNIVTSMCEAININVPTTGEDFSEQPIPEQFTTVIKDGKLVTTCNKHA